MNEPVCSSSTLSDLQVEGIVLEAAEYVTSMAGKRKLVRGGYAYIAEVLNRRGKKQYWRCARRSSTCRARIHTVDDKIINVIGEHNHLPDPALRKVLTTISQLKETAVTSPLPVNEIVANTIAGLDPAVSSQLPTIEAMRRSVHRIRQKHSINQGDLSFGSPESSKTLEIPEMYKVTSTGEDFLLFDSGSQSDSRILIFSTHQNLSFLGSSSNWIVDGSFQSIPDIFSSMLTILAVHSGQAIPLVFILLPDDTEETYRMALEMLLLIQPEMNPEFISIEFNKNCVSALREKFPHCKITARLYHLCQLLFKRIQIEQLQDRYQNDLNFSVQIRMLAALAFVPPNQVRDVFELILDNFPKEAVNVLGYFEDTFIGRYRKRTGQDEAIFPINLWNLHTNIGFETIISNAIIDNWQQTLSVLFGNQKVTVWKFLKCLQERQGTTRNIVEQLMTGVTLKGPQKKKGQDSQKFIVATVKKYDSTDSLTFLQLIASSIGR